MTLPKETVSARLARPYAAVLRDDVAADRRCGCYIACMGATHRMLAEITPNGLLPTRTALSERG